MKINQAVSLMGFGNQDISKNLNEMIAEAAYYKSEKRDFEPGHQEEDWLDAEKEVLARFAEQ
ncbi:MAG: DUF2934 domain-containing protein [Methylococcus sp.]